MKKTWIILSVLAVLMAAVLVPLGMTAEEKNADPRSTQAAEPTPAGDETKEKAQDNEPAESDELTAAEIITQNTKLDLAQYKGKHVFVNFFTEWCAYCMIEMPDVKKMFDTYDSEQLQMVMVHVWSGEDETNTQSVKDKFGMHDMLFFEDEDMAVTALVGVPGFPTSLFIDPEGNIVDAYPQMMSWEMMEGTLDRLGVGKKTEGQ